jgi:hypothetical protein
LSFPFSVDSTIRTHNPALKLQFLSRFHWSVVLLLGFSLCYACSLTFEYVDGDDASSMVYHLLGRDTSVQPHALNYQPGMDLLLRAVPGKDPLLRTTAISVTAAAALFFVLLLLALSFDRNRQIENRTKSLVAFGLFLAAPEFIYLGLLYTPVLVGLCIATSGHILLRRHLRSWWSGDHSGRRMTFLIIALLLLVTGGFFRWDLFLYPVMAFLDISTDRQLHPPSLRINPGILWRGTAVGLILVVSLSVFVHLSRTDMAASLRSAVVAAFSAPHFPEGLAGFVSAHQTLFSPAMIVSIAAGMSTTYKTGPTALLYPVFTVVLILLWPLWMSPKEILLFVPAIIVMFSSGAHRLWYCLEGKKRGAVRWGLVLIFGLPWIVGIRATYGDTAWGPGFELRRFDRPWSDAVSMALTLGSGTAAPTREGPRPLFGHAYCFVGGSWRNFVGEQANELKLTITRATTTGRPIFVAQGNAGEVIAAAAEMSLLTRSPQIKDPLITPELRIFTSRKAEELKVVRYPLFFSKRVDSTVHSLRSLLSTDTVIVFGYSSTLRTLYLVSPHSLTPIGKRSGLLNLQILEADWRRSSEHGSAREEM